MEFENLEENILRVTVKDSLTQEDIDRAGKKMKNLPDDQHNSLRLLLIIEQHEEGNESYFGKFQEALQNFEPFEKIVILSEQGWVERYAEILTGLDSTESKIFEPEEEDKALKWINSSPRHRSNIESRPGK